MGSPCRFIISDEYLNLCIFQQHPMLTFPMHFNYAFFEANAGKQHSTSRNMEESDDAE
jgi:hypothetical protein